jgi:enoyl-CoA hydratase/carnithine racemase
VIRTTDNENVRLLTLDRPDAMNAFDIHLYRALTAALDDAAADPAVHVVVLTGAGRAFSAGQDLAEMAALAEGTAPDGAETGFQGLLEVVQAYPKPLIAAVNGAAVGLGFTILGHCDLAVASTSARFKVPFAPLGVPPEAGSSYLFPARLGWQRAAEVLLTGDWVSAEQALEWELVLDVVAPEDLVDTAMSLARRIAVHPPEATQEIKRLMLAARGDAVRAAREREEAAFAVMLAGSGARAAHEALGSPPGP